MSLGLMRAALQIALSAVSGAPGIRWRDNDLDDQSSPPALPHWEVALLPNRPVNDEYGAGYREQALFQVTLCHPLGVGPGAADTQAETIRTTFFRGASFVSGGQTTIVEETPQVFPGYRDGDAWRTPITVRVYTNNF